MQQSWPLTHRLAASSYTVFRSKRAKINDMHIDVCLAAPHDTHAVRRWITKQSKLHTPCIVEENSAIANPRMWSIRMQEHVQHADTQPRLPHPCMTIPGCQNGTKHSTTMAYQELGFQLQSPAEAAAGEHTFANLAGTPCAESALLRLHYRGGSCNHKETPGLSTKWSRSHTLQNAPEPCCTCKHTQ